MKRIVVIGSSIDGKTLAMLEALAEAERNRASRTVSTDQGHYSTVSLPLVEDHPDLEILRQMVLTPVLTPRPLPTLDNLLASGEVEIEDFHRPLVPAPNVRTKPAQLSKREMRQRQMQHTRKKR